LRRRHYWLNLASSPRKAFALHVIDSFRQSLRRLWALDKFSYSVRVFIALTGSMALCWYQMKWAC
jgi:hypothetical protein